MPNLQSIGLDTGQVLRTRDEVPNIAREKTLVVVEEEERGEGVGYLCEKIIPHPVFTYVRVVAARVVLLLLLWCCVLGWHSIRFHVPNLLPERLHSLCPERYATAK